MDTNDRACWREKGVTNWAHDIGLDITHNDGRYTGARPKIDAEYTFKRDGEERARGKAAPVCGKSAA